MPLSTNVDSTTPLPVIPADSVVTGTLGSLNSTVIISSPGRSSCLMLLSGTWTGTIVVEGSTDNMTWNNLHFLQNSTAKILQTGTTVNGYFRPINIQTYTYIRARMSVYASGSASVQLNLSSGAVAVTAFQVNAENFNTSTQILDSPVGAQVLTAPASEAGQRGLAVRVVSQPTTSLGFNTVNVSDQFTVGSTSAMLINTNFNRKYIHLINNSNTTAYVQYGNPAQLNKGIKLNANAMLTLSGYELYTGPIYAISAGTSLIDILEGV